MKKYSKNNCEWLINDKKLFPWSANINKWSMGFPLRNLFSRRVAQIEIDTAVAHKLGLSLSDFLSVFNNTFLLLKQNEEDTWYDQQGRVVFTCSKGLPGVGFSRPEWNVIIDMKERDG